MYCSIPAIIGPVNEAATVGVVETSVAPGCGVTDASETVLGAVELLQAASSNAARPANPRSFTLAVILPSSFNRS
jgi:hypothetical protein